MEENSSSDNSKRVFSSNKYRTSNCRYFAADGFCSYGENCRFYHDRSQFRQYRPRNFGRAPVDAFSVDLSESDPQKLNELRNRDIGALKRLYPNCKTVEDQLLVDFVPTDPDWAFDVRILKLNFQFPVEYPSKVLSVSVVGAGPPPNDQLPDLLFRHLNSKIASYLKETFDDNETQRSRYALAVRPFLKWFDKNISSFFVEGLKKVRLDLQAKSAGISFVAPPKRAVAPKNPTVEYATEENGTVGELVTDFARACSTSEPNEDVSEDPTENKADHQTNQQSKDEKASSNAIEVKFSDFEFVQNVATVNALNLHFIFQCIRCKHRFEWTWSNSKPACTGSCAKCALSNVASFQPDTVHQYSARLGWLTVEGIVPFDLNLLPSEFKVVCLSCNETAKLKSLSWAQLETAWCRQCHAKMQLKFDGVRFSGSVSAGGASSSCGATATADGCTSTKPKKMAVKDPVMQPGQPLPEYGICKHYKKSFRWFRFPCCGKLYPCDVCHDEHEQHEIKFATRIVCGYCCKEQPFNGIKPCIACANNVTKTSASAHWEGGKGCRNATLMSTRDKQKYKNTNKTISNHAHQLKTNPNKKPIKETKE